MNTILWLIQVILSSKLLTVTYTHGLRQSQPEFQTAIRRIGSFSQPLLVIIAVCTFLGTLGLLLPGVVDSLSPLTAPAAGMTSIMLLFSIFFHIKGRDKPKIFVSIILSVLSAFVAYGRLLLAPY